MSGGFFRGTSSEQDTRFSNKTQKLLKSQKFAPELDHLVDMSKVQMDVMRPWIAARVTELLGFEDEVLINFIYGLLDAKEVDGKHIQIQLTGFMEKNTGRFMKELWSLLISAQNNVSGIPQQFLDAKAEETKKKKAEEQRIFSEIQRKKDQEKTEEERQHKLAMEQESLKKAAAVAISNCHMNSGKLSSQGDGEKSSDKAPSEARPAMKNAGKLQTDMQSSSGTNSLSPSPVSSRDSPHAHRRQRFSQSISNSPPYYRASRSPVGRRRSPAIRRSPHRPLRSPPHYRSPVRHRRSPSRSPEPLRRRHAPVLSPSRRRYLPSPSPPRRRHLPYSRSPPRRRHSPRRLHSPSNRRYSPLHSRSPPVRHSPLWRVRSPMQSLSPPRRSPPLSRSPLRSARRQPPSRSPPRRLRSPVPPHSPARQSRPALLSRPPRRYPRSPMHSLSPARCLHSPPKSVSPMTAEPPMYSCSPSRERHSPLQSHLPVRDSSSPAHSLHTDVRSPVLGQSPLQHSRSPSRSSSPGRRSQILSSMQTHSSPKPTHFPAHSIHENSICSPVRSDSPSKLSDLSQLGRSPFPPASRKPLSPLNFKSPKRKRSLHGSQSPSRILPLSLPCSPLETLSVARCSPKGQPELPAKSSSPRKGLKPQAKILSPERNAKMLNKRAEAFNGPLVQSKSPPSKTNNHCRSTTASEERRESKRSRKEERRVRKEQKRKKREERRKRREERRAAKAAAKSNISIDDVSPRVYSESDPESGDNNILKARPIEDEEMESEQKRIENELRKKALESLRARKGILPS